MANPSCYEGREPTTISFEVMPPRNPHLAPHFWSTVGRLLSSYPDFISVTYGAAGRDRSTACTVVKRLVRETPTQPIAHLTCVGAARSSVAATVNDYLDAGVRTFLALRGDPPSGQTDWNPDPGALTSATDLIHLIRATEEKRCALHPGAALRAAFKPLTIAVAAFPAGNPATGTTPEQEADRLLLKQAAGANFAITQMFWDPTVYTNFLELACARGIFIPIVVGLLPPTDPDRLIRVGNLTGLEPPDSLIKSLRNASSLEKQYEIGISAGASIAREVLNVGAPGLHLYTFNKARPALDLLDFLDLNETDKEETWSIPEKINKKLKINALSAQYAESN